MKKKYELCASLICGNPISLKDDIKALEKGGIDWIHFDVMDGSFVPRLGLYPELLKSVKELSQLPVDVHLMIDNPEQFVKAFAEAGADIIVIHAEATQHLHRAVQSIKALGVRAGVSLNPSTPLSVLDYVLGDIDMVMLMAINPGIVGHKLIPSMIDKISHLKNKLREYPNVKIEVDGGVTPESAPLMVKAGANMLVCGTSSIFKKDEDLSESVQKFRKLIELKVSKNASQSSNHHLRHRLTTR